jgi:hypothetical protein
MHTWHTLNAYLQDDEETLAAQEEEEAKELGVEKETAVKQELNELEDEANMSLEELMAK